MYRVKFPYTCLDLTHTVHQDVPTWDGKHGCNSKIVLDYDECTGDVPFRVMHLCMNAGIGTHIDAPNHCLPGALSSEQLLLDDLCMPCYVLDVSEKAHARYSVSVDDIKNFEKKYGVIEPDTCVFVYTGWSRLWNNPVAYRNDLVFPCVSVEAAQYLIERGVKALGIDTLSPDRPDNGFKVHVLFLGQGKILIENVAHLDTMPALGALCGIFPLKFQGATEVPIRLVGMLPK